MSDLCQKELVSAKRSRFTAPCLTVLRLSKLEFEEMPTLQGPDDNPFVTAVRALYDQLGSFQSHLGGPIRSVGVTSSYRHEGKSTVAAQLATIAAESLRVLLIDANEAWAKVQRAMHGAIQSHVACMGDITMEEACKRCGESTDPLQSHVNGRSPAGDGRRESLNALASKFDLLVVDLPAVSAAGALDWGPALDGILLVLEAERVRWQVAARSIRLINQAGGQVLGSIINKRRNYIPNWLYARL